MLITAVDVAPEGELEPVHQRHPELMQTAEAQALYRRRKELPEPVFGMIKEQQGGRRFLLRRLPNVQAEWSLLAVGLNLRSLCRAWKANLLGGHGVLPAPATDPCINLLTGSDEIPPTPLCERGAKGGCAPTISLPV